MKTDNKKLASSALLGDDAYKTDTEDIAGMIINAAMKAETVQQFEGLVNLTPVNAEELRNDTPRETSAKGIGGISERWEDPFYSVPRVLQ